MKIKRIVIESFRGFNEKRDFLINDAQLILIYGPNGHGKTSFFDSIEWSLTGKINRYDAPTDERNRSKFVGNTFSSKPPFVQIVLADEEQELIITRKGIKDDSKTDYGRSILGVEVSGEVCLLGNAAQGYINNKIINSEWLDKINQENLGNIFNLTHYSSQEKMNHFLKGAKEGERYDALSTILGTEQYNSYKNKFKDAQNIFKSEIDDIDDVIIEVKVKKETISNEINKLKDKAKQYNYNETQELLLKYNQLFSQHLNLDDNVDTLLQMIHKDNSNLFKERNELNQNYETLELLRNDLHKYKQKYESLSIDRNQLKIVNKLIQFNAKLLDFKWMKENYKDFIEGTKDYDNKINNKNDIKQEISALEKYIKSLDIFVSSINFTLDKSINSNNFESFRRLVTNEISNTNLKDKFFNQLIRVETNLLDIKNKENELKEIKRKKDENEVWLKNLERINNRYSTLLRHVIEYVQSIDKLDNCPVCGNKEITSEYLIDYTQKAQKEVNVDIPHAQEALNKSVDEYDQCKLQISKIQEKYKEDLNQIRLEIEKVSESIDEQRNKLTNLYKSLNNLIQTIFVIEENDSKYQRLIDEYQLELNSIEDLETVINTTQNLKDNMLKESVLLQNELNNEIVRGLNQKIEINNIFLEGYRLRLNEVSYQKESYEPETVSEFVESQFNSYRNKQKIIDEKTTLLGNLIADIESLKIQQLLRIKTNEYEKEEKALSVLENQKQGINQKISILEEASKKVPSAIETLNQKAIEELFEVVQKIYSKLNSHPIFNKVNFKKEKRYGTFKLLLNVLSDNEVEANPTYIYSAAQINTIALSLFLSMAITQEWCSLNIVAMDDPIQSMDSLNSLAYIDFLRQLTDQEGYNKQLIISTHDSSFFELMQKKFQLFDVAIIRFSGYSEAGPIFGKINEKKLGDSNLIKINTGKRIENFKELISSI
ncbi:AAA family ATPase [Neobacillus vireti]|uniref:AAA family ATPase n=1 Tax=Neobacillus vireti TaxID=220686 RepID=UPI002FFF0455